MEQHHRCFCWRSTPFISKASKAMAAFGLKGIHCWHCKVCMALGMEPVRVAWLKRSPLLCKRKCKKTCGKASRCNESYHTHYNPIVQSSLELSNCPICMRSTNGCVVPRPLDSMDLEGPHECCGKCSLYIDVNIVEYCPWYCLFAHLIQTFKVFLASTAWPLGWSWKAFGVIPFLSKQYWSRRKHPIKWSW